jgi:hypothetical protein
MGVPVVLCVCRGQVIEDGFPFASSIVMDKIEWKRNPVIIRVLFQKSNFWLTNSSLSFRTFSAEPVHFPESVTAHSSMYGPD